MTFVACTVSTVAAVCVYLTSDRQRLTRTPFHRSWRVIGMLLAVVGVWLWTSTTSIAESIFASLAVWVTIFVVLPYISWVRQPVPEAEQSARGEL